MKTEERAILFVCVENARRSQMADRVGNVFWVLFLDKNY